MSKKVKPVPSVIEIPVLWEILESSFDKRKGYNLAAISHDGDRFEAFTTSTLEHALQRIKCNVLLHYATLYSNQAACIPDSVTFRFKLRQAKSPIAGIKKTQKDFENGAHDV